MSYAENTQVPIERSRAEIESTLRKFGARKIMTLLDDELNTSLVGFEINNISYKIKIPMPDPNDPDFRKTPTGRRRKSTQTVNNEYIQEAKRRWRSLQIYIKAILIASDDKIIQLETMLMPFIILPDGLTVSETIIPQLEKAFKDGSLHVKLLGGKP